MELKDNGIVPPTHALIYGEAQDWLNLFRFSLEGEEMLQFIIASGTFLGLGLIFNACIIIMVLVYRRRFLLTSDLYSPMYASRIPAVVRWGPKHAVSATLSTLCRSIEGRSICFLALASSARLKLIHMVYANAIFNIISCVVFIPLATMYVSNIIGFEALRNLHAAVICQAWATFQVNFTALTLFVNSTILCFSIVFPLHFSLKRTPFTLSLALIILLCLMHFNAEMILLLNRHSQELYHREEQKFIERIHALQIAQAIPLGIFLGTFTGTALLHLIMHTQLSNARFVVDQLEDEANIPVWRSIIAKSYRNVVNIGIASTVFYALEIPAFLAVYNLIECHWWILLAHMAVNCVLAIIHIRLCTPLQKGTPRADLKALDEQRRKVMEKQEAKKAMMTEGDTTILMGE